LESQESPQILSNKTAISQNMKPKEAEIDQKPPQKRDKIDLFKVKDFAEMSGLPYRLILGAIKSGELRCIRGNKRYFRIRSEDGARWIVSLTKRNYA
jgi:hypothetical protein